MSFLILNYFSKSHLLISTYTGPVDYKKQENYCKGPLFTIYIWMYKSGGETLTVFREISP